jgi:hypothetical protein
LPKDRIDGKLDVFNVHILVAEAVQDRQDKGGLGFSHERRGYLKGSQGANEMKGETE